MWCLSKTVTLCQVRTVEALLLQCSKNITED